MIIYLVDHEQRELLLMRDDEAPERDVLAVEGTLAGPAYGMMRPFTAEGEPGAARLSLASGLASATAG